MKFKPVFFVILIVLILSFLTSKISGPLRYLSYPYDLMGLLTSKVWLVIENQWQAFILKKERVEQLERELDILRERLVEYENIKRENLILKGLLGLKDSRKDVVTFARVIRRGLSRWSNAVVIDKGEEDGVKKDMTVVTPRGLVGKVISAGRGFSEVLLLDDPAFRVAVRFLETRAEGIASGTGYGVLIRYVPSETEVIKNDWVITSGLDGIFPEGILVGYVSDIKEGNFFKEISVKTAQNLRSLEFVAVIERSVKP